MFDERIENMVDLKLVALAFCEDMLKTGSIVDYRQGEFNGHEGVELSVQPDDPIWPEVRIYLHFDPSEQAWFFFSQFLMSGSPGLLKNSEESLREFSQRDGQLLILCNVVPSGTERQIEFIIEFRPTSDKGDLLVRAMGAVSLGKPLSFLSNYSTNHTGVSDKLLLNLRADWDQYV